MELEDELELEELDDEDLEEELELEDLDEELDEELEYELEELWDEELLTLTTFPPPQAQHAMFAVRPSLAN